MLTKIRSSRRPITKKTDPPGGAAPQPDAAGWVTLASLVRPHGRHGELLAEILTDFPERFRERRRLFLKSPAEPGRQPREVILDDHRLHQGRVVLKFESVDTIEAAALLRGLDVVIPLTERTPLEEGAVYIADLAGCLLYDRASSTTVGEITGVDRESSNTALFIVQPLDRKHGSEVLIPFANAYRPEIDLTTRRMEMTLPEGLLTLDAPPAHDDPAPSTQPISPKGFPPRANAPSSRRAARQQRSQD